MNKATTGLLLATAAYASWGLLSPVGKILLADFPPMTLNAVRLSLATLVLAPLLPARAWREGIVLLRRPAVALLLVFGVGVQFTLFLYAVTLIDATYATLGFFTAPLWTALVARARLGEPVGWAFIPTLAALAAGAWLALFGLSGPAGDFHWGGMALAVGAGIGWAIYAVGLKEVAPDARLRPLMAASFLGNTAYFVAGALLVDGLPGAALWTAVPAISWAWMAVYVAVPTTLSLFLFAAALQRAPASSVNLLVGMELAATAVFAWLLLGDSFDAWQIAGLVVVMGAVTAYLWNRDRREPASFPGPESASAPASAAAASDPANP